MTQTNADVTHDDIMAMLAGELLPSDIHARRAAKKREQAVGRRQREIEIELEKFSTRALMAMRHKGLSDRVFKYEGSYYRGQGPDYRCEDSTEGAFDEQRARSMALYAVLNRRPHVPNKIEGQVARREAATKHHGPKKKGGSRMAKMHAKPESKPLSKQKIARRRASMWSRW